jgi:hypothetical protein
MSRFMLPVPAYTGPRLETVAAACVEAAASIGEQVMLVFQDVATTVRPGDTLQDAIASYDRKVAAIVERETDHPLLSDASPRKGDLIEALTDDHFLKIAAGSFGIVVSTTETENGEPARISVRYAVRTADYERADYEGLRHVRTPIR